MKPHLRLVRTKERPLAVLSMAEKRANALAYVKRRRIYILDQGTPKPNWGHGDPKALPK